MTTAILTTITTTPLPTCINNVACGKLPNGKLVIIMTPFDTARNKIAALNETVGLVKTLFSRLLHLAQRTALDEIIIKIEPSPNLQSINQMIAEKEKQLVQFCYEKLLPPDWTKFTSYNTNPHNLLTQQLMKLGKTILQVNSSLQNKYLGKALWEAASIEFATHRSQAVLHVINEAFNKRKVITILKKAAFIQDNQVRLEIIMLIATCCINRGKYGTFLAAANKLDSNQKDDAIRISIDACSYKKKFDLAIMGADRLDDSVLKYNILKNATDYHFSNSEFLKALQAARSLPDAMRIPLIEPFANNCVANGRILLALKAASLLSKESKDSILEESIHYLLSDKIQTKKTLALAKTLFKEILNGATALRALNEIEKAETKIGVNVGKQFWMLNQHLYISKGYVAGTWIPMMRTKEKIK